MGKFMCDICNIYFDRPYNLQRHYSTAKHEMNVMWDNVECDLDSDDDDALDEVNGHMNQTQNNYHYVNANAHEDERMEYSNTDGPHDTVHETENSNNVFNDTNVWFPFPDKLSLLLYGLIHSPTHHVSNEIARYIWFILKEANVQNLPSLGYIKSLKFGELDIDQIISKGVDENGIPVYFLKPTEIAKMQIANPDISSQIARYPRLSQIITGQMDGSRCQEVLSPWAHSEDTGFIIGEFVAIQRDASVYGKIEGFFDNVEKGAIVANVDVYVDRHHNLVKDENLPEMSLVRIGQKKMLKLCKLQPFNNEGYVLFDREENGCNAISEEERQQLLTVPAQRKPIISVPINLFIDDTSTNISRRWQAMHCIQMQLAGLPLENRQKEQFSNFLGASENTSALQISKLVIDDVLHSQQVEAFDAVSRTEVIIKSEIALVVADFNMLSLTCNHMGASATKFCPKCDADSISCCTKGRERKPTETKRTIERLNMRSNEGDRKKLRKQTGVKEFANPFWDVLNPHRDVPSGVLHLFHLGVSKHLVKHCLQSLTEQQCANLELHINSLDSHQKIGFQISKHIDSRQGKDLKKYIQIAPFNLLFAGLKLKYIKMVCLMSQLNKLVHNTSFNAEDMQNLQLTVDKYLEMVEQHAPELKKKVKTHLLTHLVDEVKRHGPPTGYSEDVFEKRHGAIRAKLFHQENQLARSRDTATIFAENFILQHVLMGGFFKSENCWRQSSERVQNMGKSEELKRYLGCSEQTKKLPGILLRPERNANFKPVFKDVALFQSPNVLLQGLLTLGVLSPTLTGQMIRYSSLICRDGQAIVAGSPVLFLNGENEIAVGIFKEAFLLVQLKERHNLVRIQKTRQHPPTSTQQRVLNCPMIEIVQGEEFVRPGSVNGYIPLVHDCVGGQCIGKEGMLQQKIEQENRNINLKFIKHNTDYAVYFVNEYSITLPPCYDKYPKLVV